MCYDVILISETWLCDSINSSEYFPSSYNIIRCDRRFDAVGRATGGGVLLGLHNSILYDVLDTSHLGACAPLIDLVLCKCVFGSQVLLIGVIYIPPDLHRDVLESFLDALQMILLDRPILLVGDFNSPEFCDHATVMPSSSSLNLTEFCNSLDLKQINWVRNEHGRILDLVLSNLSSRTEILHDENPFVPEDSYHPALSITTNLMYNRLPQFMSGRVPRYNYNKVNYDILINILSGTDWSVLDAHTDVDRALSFFYSRLYSALDLSVPKYTPSSSSYPPWFTKVIKENLKMKDYYRRKWKLTNNQIYLDQFKRLRFLSKRQISDAYRVYVHHAETTLTNNPKRIWSFVHSKQGTTRIPGRMTHNGVWMDAPKDIVDAFASTFASLYNSSNISDLPQLFSHFPSFSLQPVTEEFLIEIMARFSTNSTAGDDSIPSFLIKNLRTYLAKPLCTIINLSIKSSIFPNQWKRTRIIPVFKKDDKSSISNYRPISILSNFSKILEQVMYSYIYFNTSPLISTLQHGFISGRSVLTNLATFTQHISEVIDGRGQVDVVYMDFSRAFDRIDHSLLLHKLAYYGFTPPLLNLIKSYISNRSNYVFYNGYKSYDFYPTSGVPQGSNLGPVLFNLFINDLYSLLTCQALAYADDLKIFTTVANDDDSARLQRNIDAVIVWSETNNLTLNIDKCYCMTFTRKSVPCLVGYSMDRRELQRVQTIRDLGVLLDTSLSFNPHIVSICSAASRMLGFVIRISRFFTSACLLRSLYFALVVSKLEFASIIWYPYYISQQLPIDRIQRRFLRFLTFKTTGTYPDWTVSYDRLLEMHQLQSLTARRVIHSARFLFKLVNGRVDCPQFLACVPFNVPRFSARHAASFNLSTARSNMLVKSPLHHMTRNAELVYSDIFSGELK